MALDPCLDLLSAAGTEIYVSSVPRGQCYPATKTFTTTDAAAIGDTTIAGTVNPTTTTLKAGARLRFGNQVVRLTADYSGTGPLTVLPLVAAIASGATASFYGGIEVLAVEAGGISSTRQSNQVTLLSSGGWRNMSPSDADWSLAATIYIPKDPLKLEAYNTIKDAFYNAKFLFLERFLPNGESFQAPAMLSSFNDTVSGNGYVQIQVTFNGNAAPIVDGVLASSAIV